MQDTKKTYEEALEYLRLLRSELPGYKDLSFDEHKERFLQKTGWIYEEFTKEFFIRSVFPSHSS